jgi:rhodanese-related sulfurtransferase/DNA-binding transcriptional ArsR family regulator
MIEDAGNVDDAKRQIYGGFAAVARALGHVHRLALLEQLAQGETAVDSLAQHTGLSVANTSQHLQQLRHGGLVRSRRDGKHVLYRLADGPIVEAMTLLREIAERNLAEVREAATAFARDLDGLEPVSRAELLLRLEEGSAILLDVRPSDEYRLGHLPGALNVSVDAIASGTIDLPKEREIIAYCRGPYCILSAEAVRLLRRQGFNVRRLEDGFPEWRAAGLAVEATG